MIKEHDTVVLLDDLDQHGLEAGDIGAVVHCYPGDQGYEVEFVTFSGQTAALVTICERRSPSGTGRDAQELRNIVHALSGGGCRSRAAHSPVCVSPAQDPPL